MKFTAIATVSVLSVLTSPAWAQSPHVELAAQTFIETCINSQGDAQLAKLSLARGGVFKKKKEPTGLFGEQIGSGSTSFYTHPNKAVSVVIMDTRFGADLCSISIKKPKDLNATNRAIAESLAGSALASSSSISAKKTGKKIRYTVQFGSKSALIGRSLVGKNSSITMD